MIFRNKTRIANYVRRYRRGGGPGGGGGQWRNIPNNSKLFDQPNQPVQELSQHTSKGQVIESLKQRSGILKKQLDTILTRIHELRDKKGRRTQTYVNFRDFINENR